MTRAALILAALAALLSAPMTAHAQRLRVPGVGEVAVQPPPPPAPAQQRPSAPPAARAQPEAQAPDIPMGSVVSIVSRRAPPGRLQDVKLVTSGGRSVYIAQWRADDGRRIGYTVDAKTGAISP